MKTDAKRSEFTWVQAMETEDDFEWTDGAPEKEGPIGATAHPESTPRRRSVNPVILPATVALGYILFLSAVEVLKRFLM